MSRDPLNNLPENIFQVVFENSPGSLLVKADLPRFTILAASDMYLQVTAKNRHEILGRGFSDVFPENDNIDDSIKAHNIFTQVVTLGKKIDVANYRYDIYDPATKSYEEHYWSCSNVPIMGTDNQIAYILNTVIDITEEVKAKEAAIESENRLIQATEVAGLATWSLDLLDQSFLYSPRLIEIFGRVPDTVLTIDDVRSQITADDMENIVTRSFKRALVTGEYLYEVRIKWPDESIHWIKTQGAVIFDNTHHPLRMLGTIVDITESKRDEIRKNDFIAMASHELKTPLTSIKAYVQLLAKKLTPSDDLFVNSALEKAGIQINKMADLIYGFLDLSRLESGKLPVRMMYFDINGLIKEIIEETMLLNYSHNIIFKDDNVINIYADRDKIGQVVSNFLSNAIKYSPKESTITVTSTIMGANVRVAINDEGIGIKRKDQGKLFQRFYRVENERIKNISGFGIGLYLASEIIQRHKGKIWVESEEEKGSTFYFSLPRPR